MKYFTILFLFVLVSFLDCSPRLSPDASWGYGRWILTEMKGVPVQLSGGRRDAFIDFDIAAKTFTGNGGCNQINGNYQIDKNNIRFTDVVSTKMNCPDISFENTFLSTLGSVNRFEMRGNDILLKRKRDVVLVLSAR